MFSDLNVTADLMLEMGRPRRAMWEVVLWEDILTVEGREAYYAYQVDNQAIVIPENIDAIRAVAGREHRVRGLLSNAQIKLSVSGSDSFKPDRFLNKERRKK